MMAEAILTPDILMRQVVLSAGGDPALSSYRVDNQTLTVPDVTQAALDAAVAAYDPTAADNATKDERFANIDQAKVTRLLFEALFNHENRIRTNAGQATITRAQFIDGLRNVWRGL